MELINNKKGVLLMFELIEELKREILVILMAAMPISELRGAIPLGISLGFKSNS